MANSSKGTFLWQSYDLNPDPLLAREGLEGEKEEGKKQPRAVQLPEKTQRGVRVLWQLL